MDKIEEENHRRYMVKCRHCGLEMEATSEPECEAQLIWHIRNECKETK